MRELHIEREALRRLIARSLGDDHRQPRGLTGHLRVVGLESDILALPVSRSSEEAIQVMDPADGLYGQFRFMAGVSRLDGSDVLL